MQQLPDLGESKYFWPQSTERNTRFLGKVIPFRDAWNCSAFQLWRSIAKYWRERKPNCTVKIFYLFVYWHISPCAGSSRIKHFILPLKQTQSLWCLKSTPGLSRLHYCNPPNLCETSTNKDSKTQHLSKYKSEFRAPVGAVFPKDQSGFGVTHQPTGWLSSPPRCRLGRRRARGPGGCSRSRCRNEWLQKLQQGGEITAEPPACTSDGSWDQRDAGTNLARSSRTPWWERGLFCQLCALWKLGTSHRSCTGWESVKGCKRLKNNTWSEERDPKVTQRHLQYSKHRDRDNE